MDPIQTMVELHGEAVRLGVAAGAAPYDPASPVPYNPAAKVWTDLRGYTEAKMLRDSAPQAAVAALTISATALPAGLKSDESELEWSGVTYIVAGWRTRHFRGSFNGYTLFLRK